jgi:hypothetical protein
MLAIRSILEREFVHELKELENESIALEDKISNAKHAKVMDCCKYMFKQSVMI